MRRGATAIFLGAHESDWLFGLHCEGTIGDGRGIAMKMLVFRKDVPQLSDKIGVLTGSFEHRYERLLLPDFVTPLRERYNAALIVHVGALSGYIFALPIVINA
ncbi:hypothetical protein Tco_0007789 [Tanacetum coccineum]